VPSPTVGRITTRAAFAELQRSRARGSSGSVRAVFAPAPSANPNSAADQDHSAPNPSDLGSSDLRPSDPGPSDHGPSDHGPSHLVPSGSPAEPFPQVGFAVSRQCGSAVVRNRLRRRARAVVRDEAPLLPRGRYLLRFSPASASASPAAFRADVAQALHRAAREQAVRGR
jgi:ribonuclease P protein component